MVESTVIEKTKLRIPTSVSGLAGTWVSCPGHVRGWTSPAPGYSPHPLSLCDGCCDGARKTPRSMYSERRGSKGRGRPFSPRQPPLAWLSGVVCLVSSTWRQRGLNLLVPSCIWELCLLSLLMSLEQWLEGAIPSELRE